MFKATSISRVRIVLSVIMLFWRSRRCASPAFGDLNTCGTLTFPGARNYDLGVLQAFSGRTAAYKTSEGHRSPKLIEVGLPVKLLSLWFSWYVITHGNFHTLYTFKTASFGSWYRSPSTAIPRGKRAGLSFMNSGWNAPVRL